jgi:hypothetical protein
MPNSTEEKFGKIENLVKDLVPKAANLVGLANPAFFATNFAVDTLLKFIRLGIRIRKAKQEGIDRLDEKVRSEGIIRIPISASTNLASLENFYLRRTRLMNPIAFEQFKEEITDALISRLDHTEQQLELLKFGRIVISGYDRKNKRWIDPILAEHFSEINRDEEINYKLLAKELMLFAQKNGISLNDLEDIIPKYLMNRVLAMDINIQKLTQEEMETINEQITRFAFETILGDQGTMQNTTDFLIRHKQLKIEEEIEKLNEMLEREPDEDEDPEVFANENEQIRERIEDLEAEKEEMEKSRPTFT